MAALTYWTLEYDGSERTLEDWGFSDEGVVGEFGNMVVDTLHVQAPEVDLTDDEIIPFEGQVIIRSGRVAEGGEGFSGGAVEFQGKRLLHILQGRPDYEGVVYQFGGPWYDVDATAYQQEYLQCTGGDPAWQIAYASDVFLFQKVDPSLAGGLWPFVSRVNNGEMIARILSYCLSVVPEGESAPFQIGTIDPAVPLNTYQARDLKCSEAIHHCLRASPDCAVQFDYSTIPPTINVRKRANVAPKSVTFAEGVEHTGIGGRRHEAITLTPRYDLQPASIVVRFKANNLLGEQSIIVTTTQKYPVDGPEGGRGVVVATVDLEGYRITAVGGRLDCVAFTNDRAWWKTHFAELKTSKTRQFRIGPLTYTDPDTGKDVTLAATTIKDASGSDVNPAVYPNQLRDGAAIAPWMKLEDGTPVVGVKVTITAEISCKEYDVEASGDVETSTNGRMVSKYLRKQIEAHVTLTNGVTGPYSTIASSESGEEIPAGMAQGIYEGLAVLQYQGTFSVVERECETAVWPGDTLNITNGRAEWATMKALVQRVTKDYGTGRTTITLGPAAHLSAGDLTQMFLINRRRMLWKNNLVQASGLGSNQDSKAVLGDKAPSHNSLHGLKEPSQVKVTAPADGTNRTEVHHDAEGQKIALQTTDATGAVVADTPQISLGLQDLQYATPANAKVKCRRAHYPDAQSGEAMRCYLPASCPESDATDDGHSDEVEDLYLGGVTMMSVVSYHQDATYGDYLVCQPDGEGAATVNAAVEPQLQSRLGFSGGIYSETKPDGNTWQYSGYNAAAQRRTATCISGPLAGRVLTEYITPPFVFEPVADRIKVQACANTGVSVGGVAVTLIEDRGRHWAAG
jgi:hypothetical protein